MLLRHALDRTTTRPAMSLPWEHGWLRTIIGDGSIMPDPLQWTMAWEGPVPSRPWEDYADMSEEEDESAKHRVKMAEFKTLPMAKLAWRKRKLVKKGDEKDVKHDPRGSILSKWAAIVEDVGPASGLYQKLLGHDEEERLHIIKDTFAEKSTATLCKRACSLLLFCRWARPLTDSALFPFSEGLVYEYLRFLRREKAPATRAQSLLEAIAFSVGLLEIKQMEVVMSPRVRGSSHELWSGKRILRPRDPFTKEMVATLENLTVNHADLQTRVFAGFVTALIHCRCRVSDAQRATVGPDRDYCAEGRPPVFHVSMETVSDRIKTGQARKKARRAYHIVGHAVGISKVNWADGWIEARDICGLALAFDGCLMPVPQGVSFGDRGMSNEEMTMLLRELLVQAGFSPSSVWNIGMHSPKATLLSWCAKYGLSKEVRKDLGGHVPSEDVTVAAYSRDLLAAPLRELAKVLKAIRRGIFNPDATRAGAWHGMPEGDETDTDGDATPTEKGESSEEGDQADSSSDDEENPLPVYEESVLEAAHAKVETMIEMPESLDKDAVVPKGGIWRHASRGTLHLHESLLGRGEDRLICRRKGLNVTYTKLPGWPVNAVGKCKACFGLAAETLAALD